MPERYRGYLAKSDWVVPPVAQGQIVERAYRLVEEDALGVPIIRRTTDRSDGSVTYQVRYLGEDEAFEPWQSEPAESA